MVAFCSNLCCIVWRHATWAIGRPPFSMITPRTHHPPVPDFNGLARSRHSLDGTTTTAVVKSMADFVALQWARRAVPPATAASRWSRFADPLFFMLLYDSRCDGFLAVGECAASVCAESFYEVPAGCYAFHVWRRDGAQERAAEPGEHGRSLNAE